MAELTDLARALSELEKEKVDAVVDSRLKSGAAAVELIKELNSGMSEVGERFSRGEYFLSELIYSSHIMKGVMEKLEPLLKGKAEQAGRGKVIIGTVKGDIHDIGKNIVVALLRGVGFEVIDLGVDVPAAKFVQAIRENDARIVGLSALLNFTIPEMKHVVDEIGAAGLRDKVKIILGGAPTDEQVRAYSGADYYAVDAPQGIKICRQIYGI